LLKQQGLPGWMQAWSKASVAARATALIPGPHREEQAAQPTAEVVLVLAEMTMRIWMEASENNGRN
jgi:hypothetical protein